MQVVIFVIDSSPSMNQPYPAGSSRTRLDVAKEAVQNMLCDLLIASHTNRVNIIVCKTALTRHHLIRDGTNLEEEEDVAFPNIVELSGKLAKPSVHLLRAVARIQSTLTPEESDMARGDVIDGIMVAADALYEETRTSKAAERRIVILTDAEHDFVVDEWQSNQLILSMLKLNCRMEVIGLDFQTSADFSPSPFDVRSTDKIVITENPGASGKEIVYSDKKEKEAALVRIAEQTGGTIVAASTLQQVLEINKGLKMTSATLGNIKFIVAPGLEVSARRMAMNHKFDMPHISQKVVLVNEDNELPRLDEDGNVRLDDIKRSYAYMYETELDKTVAEMIDETETVRAYLYSTETVPFSDRDENQLLSLLDIADKPARIEVLGYIDRNRVPDHYLSGPPYLISGATDHQACVLISTLAQALFQTNMVAVCMFYKLKGKSGHFGALFPLPEPDYPTLVHLTFMAFPYAGDVQDLNEYIFPLGDFFDANKTTETQVIESLIDSLMLPDDFMIAGSVPSPISRSWYQTLIKRATDPAAGAVLWRQAQQVDPISAPPEVLHSAQSALDSFRKAFPLRDLAKMGQEEKERNKREKGKRAVLNFEDYLEA